MGEVREMQERRSVIPLHAQPPQSGPVLQGSSIDPHSVFFIYQMQLGLPSPGLTREDLLKGWEHLAAEVAAWKRIERANNIRCWPSRSLALVSQSVSISSEQNRHLILLDTGSIYPGSDDSSFKSYTTPSTIDVHCSMLTGLRTAA